MTPRTLAGDRYVLERKLGNGGMASVYLARDPKLDRPVAVKLLAENIAEDRDARRRFEREARLAAKLDHPNVVKVFDVGEEDGRPFIVMEHVDGGTVGDLAERRRPPRKRTLELLSQACAGLGHAHSEGLVHRDVKPQNLLISRGSGAVKIADFGIARAVEEAGITSTGLVLGTRPYMAPEQLEGGKLTPATDVYALGVLGRELLGERLPAGLESVLDRCVSENPRRRFADAGEVGEALMRAGTGEIPPTERLAVDATAPRTRSRRTTRALPPRTQERDRRPLVAVLAGVAALGLVVAAIVVGTDGSGSRDAPKLKPAPALDDPAEQGRALADWLRDRSASGGQ
jgi:serine/threonine-protein kinase